MSNVQTDTATANGNENETYYSASKKEESNSKLNDSDSESESETEEESDEEETIRIINPDNIKLNNCTIMSVYEQFLKNNSTELQPSYQRSLSWSFEKMLLLLDSLYYCPIIPAFILYKLSKKELQKIRELKCNTNKKYECIDGQHRLITIEKFISGQPIIIGNVDKYLYIKDRKTNEKLFYIINDEIKKKYKKNIRKLDIDEIENFNSTQLSIHIITQYLDDLSKRNIFNRLQNGDRVSTIDKLKNYENPITNYLRSNGYFQYEKLFSMWKNIIILNGKTVTKEGRKINFNNLIYFMIRLIIITNNKNLNINYLSTNINKSLEHNTDMTKIDKQIEYLMGIIKKNITRIEDVLQGKKISIEFYYLIHNLLINNKEDNFRNIKKILDNKKKFEKFNEIHNRKSKTTLKIETMEDKYKEFCKLL